MHGLEWMARGAVAGLMLSAALPSAAAAQDTNRELATALKAQHVALTTGVNAASHLGRPISAKYEYEDGKLQLSVYTEKAGSFSEVVVDHHTGKVAKTEKITEGEDLQKAQAQSAAAAKGRSSLASAMAKALKENKGYSVISGMDALEGGKPVAQITLLKGSEFKSVTEPLN